MSNAWDSFAAMSASDRVQTLRDAIKAKTVATRSIDFADDLLSKYTHGGQDINALSPKQWAWLGHLAGQYDKDSVYAWINASDAGKGAKRGKASSGYRRTYRRKAAGDSKAKTGAGSKAKAKTAQDAGPSCTEQERRLLDAMQTWVKSKGDKRARYVKAILHPETSREPWAEELFKAWL